MKKLLGIFTVLLCSLNISCHYLLNTVNKTISYKTKDNEQTLPKIVNIYQEINTSPNAKNKYVFPLTVYQYYSSPFTLQIIIENQNENIQSIIFKSCIIIVNGKETDLLNDKEVDVMSSRYYKKTKTEKSMSSNIIEMERFNNTKELILNESNDVIIKSYYINFSDIPINPDKDKEIVIKYEISVVLNRGETLSVVGRAVYYKQIEEVQQYHPIHNPKEKDK